MPAMESKLARQLQEDLIVAVRRLTPEERLRAFLAHSRLMAELHAAARRAGLGRPTLEALEKVLV
jgi:hypothetical protein